MKRCISCKSLFPLNSSAVECPYCHGRIVSIKEELDIVRAKKSKSAPKGSKMKKVLVVDDVGFIADGIKYVLESEGFVVNVAHSADEAMEKIGKERYDVTVLDIMMPGMPVKDLVTKIDPETTSIIYCSALPEKEAEGKTVLKKDNIVGYLRKPFDIELLLNTVQSVI